jgi:NADH-quinone oxidoreductase subunit N
VIVTTGDLLAILPLIIVATTALVVMLAIAVRRVHRLTASLTLTGLTLAFVSLFVAARFAVRSVTPLLIVDGLGLAFLGLILAAGLVVTLFTYVYLERGVEQRDEHYLLLLIAILGTMVLAMSVHWGGKRSAWRCIA